MGLKVGKCPKCCPEGGMYFRSDLEHTDEGFVRIWVCNNCGHTKRVGKSPLRVNAQNAAIERIRKAVESAGSSAHPVQVEEFTVKRDPSGDVYVTVIGAQGPKDSVLNMVTFRILGIRLSRGGGLQVYSDSKAKTDADKEEVSRQLRGGELYVW